MAYFTELTLISKAGGGVILLKRTSSCCGKFYEPLASSANPDSTSAALRLRYPSYRIFDTTDTIQPSNCCWAEYLASQNWVQICPTETGNCVHVLILRGYFSSFQRSESSGGNPLMSYGNDIGLVISCILKTAIATCISASR